GAVVLTNKAYEAITAPAKRRRITVIKRQTTDAKAIQDARSLGRELFHEMGPDGEDAVFSFLQNKLKSWQTSLSGYKPLADTGSYQARRKSPMAWSWSGNFWPAARQFSRHTGLLQCVSMIASVFWIVSSHSTAPHCLKLRVMRGGYPC